MFWGTHRGTFRGVFFLPKKAQKLLTSVIFTQSASNLVCKSVLGFYQIKYKSFEILCYGVPVGTVGTVGVPVGTVFWPKKAQKLLTSEVIAQFS